MENFELSDIAEDFNIIDVFSLFSSLDESSEISSYFPLNSVQFCTSDKSENSVDSSITASLMQWSLPNPKRRRSSKSPSFDNMSVFSSMVDSKQEYSGIDDSNTTISLLSCQTISLPESDLQIDNHHKLGQGSFSKVFKGLIMPKCKNNQDESKFIKVAVKIATFDQLPNVDVTLNSDETQQFPFESDVTRNLPRSHPRQMMEREVKKLTMLNEHENIVEYLGYFVRNNCMGIILEFAEYGSIDTVLTKVKKSQKQGGTGVLPPCVVTQWLQQLCSAISFMHKNRQLHRDIKPANILLMTDLSIRLNDFGFTRDLDTSKSTYSGTELYMAPERLQRGEPSTEASDIYSFGVTALQMILNKVPDKEHLNNILVYYLTYFEDHYLQKDPNYCVMNHLVRDLIISGCLEVDCRKRIREADALIAFLQCFVVNNQTILRVTDIEKAVLKSIL